MLQKFRAIRKMLQIAKHGEYIGDAAVYKLTILYKNEGESPYRKTALTQRELNYTPIHLENLSKMPAGSLGETYYKFMLRNKLKPLNFSPDTFSLFERYPVSIRYTRLHDLFHTLLGFEADIAGEIGVYAFVGEQKYIPALNKAALTAKFVGSLFFWKYTQIKKAKTRGKALAKNAKILINQPFETMLEKPLLEVRRDLLGHTENLF